MPVERRWVPWAAAIAVLVAAGVAAWLLLLRGDDDASSGAAPRIVPNVLSTAEDIRDAVEGVRLIRRLAATEPLAGAVAEELVPGPAVDGDEALAEDFRRRAGTVYHPCGTCGMGPDPARAVVDARLRVHGIHGLRVVDASIFPLIVSGNTNAPVLMIAEKAVDLIRRREKWVNAKPSLVA